MIEDTLVFVLAGGEGRRLRPLTEGRPKPTLPFAGNARVIDFTLANCNRSGLGHVWVLGQYRPEELGRHLRGRWEHVGLRTPHPTQAGYAGTAHAVACSLDLVDARGARQVLVTASDHVYWMDYGPLLQHHRERGAAATIAGAEVDLGEASRFGIMAIDGDSRIVEFEEKPAAATPLPGRRDRALASMGIYVFDAEVLRDWLRGDGAERFQDFGGDLVPALLRGGQEVYAHVCGQGTGDRSYWRDIGSVHSYWRSSLEMVHPTSPHRLAGASAIGPVPGCGCRSCGERLVGGNAIGHAVISCGPAVRNARVERSVLCCGVAVGEDAEIEDTVVLEGARIGRGARLRGVVVDRGADIPARVTVQSRHPDPWNGGQQDATGVVPGLPGSPHLPGPGAQGSAASCESGCCHEGCGCSPWGSVSPYGPGPGAHR